MSVPMKIFFPANNSSKAILNCRVVQLKEATNICAYEAGKKLKDVKYLRLLRRLAESQMRRHKRGEWKLPNEA